MNELTTISNSKKRTSKELADFIGKRHDNVIRDIRNELEALGSEGHLIFEESYYFTEQNKKAPCFLLNEEGIMQLALKYDAVTRRKAVQFITSNTPKIPQTFSQALMLAAKQQEQIEEQQKKIAMDKPKVDYVDQVLDTQGGVDFGVAAKMLKFKGLGRNNLFELFREKGFLYKKRTVPQQQHIDNGRFIVNQSEVKKSGKSYPVTKFTQKGLYWAWDYLKSLGYETTVKSIEELKI